MFNTIQTIIRRRNVVAAFLRELVDEAERETRQPNAIDPQAMWHRARPVARPSQPVLPMRQRPHILEARRRRRSRLANRY
jgi:hypothetical protein